MKLSRITSKVCFIISFGIILVSYKEVPCSECERIEEQAHRFLSDNQFKECLAYINYSLFSRPDCVYDDELKIIAARAYLALGDTLAADSILIKIARSESKKADDALDLLESYHQGPVELPAAIEKIGADTVEPHETAVGEPDESSEILQKTVSNYFFETDIRQVLSDISQEIGVPIVSDQTVQGLVTYEAEDVPLSEILDAILFPQGLVYTIRHGTIFIGSASPEEGSFSSLSTTRMVSLANQTAMMAVDLLSDHFKPYVKADKMHNTVLITAPPTITDRIEKDLHLLDHPQPQVLIEAMVVEVVTDRLRELGINWNLTGSKDERSFSIGATSPDIENGSIEATYTREGLKMGSFLGDFTAAVQALVQTGGATIRANPRISTINGHTATINITKEQYFIITTGQEGQFTSFYDRIQAITSGIKLVITPYVGEDGEITVLVQPEVGDVVGEGANGLPEISRRSVDTTVRVKNSETITLGGLTLMKESKLENKVPFLGSVPILGYLFKYSRKEVREYELVVFITPHVL